MGARFSAQTAPQRDLSPPQAAAPSSALSGPRARSPPCTLPELQAKCPKEPRGSEQAALLRSPGNQSAHEGRPAAVRPRLPQAEAQSPRAPPPEAAAWGPKTGGNGPGPQPSLSVLLLPFGDSLEGRPSEPPSLPRPLPPPVEGTFEKPFPRDLLSFQGRDGLASLIFGQRFYRKDAATPGAAAETTPVPCRFLLTEPEAPGSWWKGPCRLGGPQVALSAGITARPTAAPESRD